MVRKPDPAILFSILNAIAEITQIIVLIQKISQGRKERPGAEGELKLLGINPDALWFALGDWVWRLRLLLASINQPRGDLLVAEWSPSIEDDLESLCDTFRAIFEEASIPAAALNSDLDTILRRCHQRAEGLRPIDAQAVLSPFVSASSGIWSELDSFRADLWVEWMVPRFARPSDWWEDPSDDSGPETPIYPPGWMVDVATAGDDLLEPSENGTAAAPPEMPDLVTLDQAAGVVNKTAHGLRHYRKRGMPKPHVRGRKGQSHEYLWSEMRPWLERTFNRPIPVDAIRRFREER